MNKTKIENRRQHVRLSAYHLVKYRLVSEIEKQAEPKIAIIKNVAKGGVCLKIEEYLPKSTLLELSINFPSVAAPIFALARVVWIKEIRKTKRYEVGVQFVQIDEIMQQVIDEQIKLVFKRFNKKIN